jgi:fatty-acyl-CoA synthase
MISHPGVREAAVIAVPHEKWLDRPLACVVAKPDFAGNPAQEAILEFLRPGVTRLWLPEVLFIASLPRTSAGKLNKKKLRNRIRSEFRFSGIPWIDTAPDIC